jgi:Chlorophyll A-B binding protein
MRHDVLQQATLFNSSSPFCLCEQAEITHGRVAMLATLGWLVPDTRTTIGAVADSSVASALFGHSSFDFGAEALRNPILAAQALGPQFFGELIVIAAAIELYRSALHY